MEKDYIDRLLLSIKEEDKEVDRLKKEFGLTLEEIIAVSSILWLKMDRVDLQSAINHGLIGSLRKIDKIIDTFYKETVLTNYELYAQGIYKEGYSSALKLLPEEMRPSRGFKNDKWVREQINTRWHKDGSLYSDNIWKHKESLKGALDRSLREHILKGSDIKKVSRAFAKDMGVSYRNAERLVRTETNFLMNQSELQCLIDAGVKKYQYAAKLDRRTSSICRAMDNKVFNVSQAVVGVNYPPLHPNCRSTVMPNTEE